MRRYLRDRSALRVPRSVRDMAYRALQAREKIVAEKGGEPSVGEIAAALQVSTQDVVYAMDAICDPVSLYEPVYTDGGESLCVMDQISDTQNTDDSWIEQLALSEAMNRLGEREKRILALRFFQGNTQMEVAAQIGISQAQVSRLEKTAIAQIKKGIAAS